MQERQDVGKLVAIAEEFENRVKKGLVESNLEAPVHVVIKVPCIAVRYPASTSTVSLTALFRTNRCARFALMLLN